MPKKQNEKRPAMRLDERKMAVAGAAAGGLSALGMGMMAMGMGWSAYGNWFMMGGACGGYGFFPLGVLAGTVWSLLLGAAFGYVLAWAYNRA